MCAVLAGLLLAAAPALAQDPGEPELTPPPQRGAVATAAEVITVRGTKKSAAQSAQVVPLSIAAFSGAQLEARQIRDLEGLTYTVPNVTLDGIGTVKGVANFTIRGLGINSSIPSIDPTVGVFVDGMYLGVTAGVVFDTFDLEAIEVLRGPQGLLFGRNVTGGAVLVRSRRPGDEVAVSLRAGAATGPEPIAAGAIDLPLVPELLKTRLSLQYRHDMGFYTNDFNGNDDYGEDRNVVFKNVTVLTPIDNVEITTIYEHGDSDGDGPAAQNRALFSGFDVTNDEEGLLDLDWDNFVVETNVDTPGFGAGRITNIFGYRQLDQKSLSDIDALGILGFHANAFLEQEQFSNELRYNGRFLSDRLDVTAGVYYFAQSFDYRERRNIPVSAIGAVFSTFGGDQEQDTWGAFLTGDTSITDRLILTTGIRYTWEEKDVKIRTFELACQTSTCPVSFVDKEDWDNWSPKIGLQFWARDDVQIYTHWTRGYRSGGYNMRDTDLDPGLAPGPTDEEEQDAFELGAKTEWCDGRLRVNAAGFYSTVNDMQREVNLSSVAAGVVQLIRNTADAEIYGAELDVSALLTEQLVLTASVGYVDGQYKKVREDLNGDGMVDSADKKLEIPRIANWTANAGLIYDQPIADWMTATLQFNYGYRDSSFFTDNNLGTLPSGHVVDLALTLRFDRLCDCTVTGYAKNLNDEAFRGGDTITPFGTFSPLKKGRTAGAEVAWSF